MSLLALGGCANDSVVTASESSAGGRTGGGNGGDGQGAEGGGVGSIPGTYGVGHDCGGDSDCRSGLACTSGACAFAGTTEEGQPCLAASECKAGMQCVQPIDAGKPAKVAVCATPPATAGDVGAGCFADLDCKGGLRCGIVGLAAGCVPQGTADVGQSCVVSSDCYAGLICAPSSGAAAADGGAAAPPMACAPLPPGTGLPFGIPTAPKVVCEQPTQGDVAAYFDVPGADGTDPEGDFFRFPIPNDARITGGKIDLTGFPTPGSLLLGFDPVQIYVDAITKHESAWGAYPTVFFRFSGPINFKTFSGSAASEIFFLDITDPKQPENGGAQWTYSGGRGLYICDNWFAVRRGQGAPLTPGHTYTVYLTTGGEGTNGNAVTRPPQFVTMLGATKPGDAALAHAWQAFAPLRAYLAEQAKLGADGITADQLLVGTVFTVADTRAPMAALADAALKAPAPEATDWVKCGGSAKSPCPQADGDRACGEPTTDYDEYQMLVKVPVYQQGTEPYLKTGGDIDPAKPRTEEVCASLTVPKSTMPAAGFPVAVFAHGTGGSFRDGIRDDVAGALARSTPPIAVLGYDQVMHGPRRGASTDSPNHLFFNFKNPDAARGNPMQGGADVITMGRLAGAIDLPATLTGGAAVKTDAAHVVFFGHSQGSMHGSLGLPYTNDYSAAVLSGNGASLMHALLTKTAPENIAQAVPFALGGDYDNKKRLLGGESHPVLSLLQQWIDPADPLNFAVAISKTPETGILPKSVFQTYGLADTYSPPVTLQTYALAAQMNLVAHDPSVTTPDDIGGLKEQPAPLAGNLTVAGHKVTLGVREYANDGGDGHFVVFDVPSANGDAIRFLSMAAGGKIPQIGK